MDRLYNVIEVTKQTHHLPALLSLLLGLIVIKKKPSIFFGDGKTEGDNFPVMLMESMRR